MIDIRDIYFASFLVDEGFEISNFTKEGRIVVFIFDIDPDLHSRLKLKFLSSKYNQVKKQIGELKTLGA